MAVLVLFLEALLVNVGVRVDVIAVAVLVLVLGVLVFVLGVGVLVLHVPVAVGVRVRLVVLVIGCLRIEICHDRTRSFRRAVLRLHRAAATEAEDREVGESRLVAEAAPDGAPDRIELSRLDARHLAAALAGEVFALLRTHQRIQARAMTDVDVADQSELLELGEVPVNRGCVHRRAGPAHPPRQVLGGDRPIGIEERLEHEPPGRRDPVSAVPEGLHRLLQVAHRNGRAERG